jgi:predicted lipoprotein with Yx(FWY)xxD motif
MRLRLRGRLVLLAILAALVATAAGWAAAGAATVKTLSTNELGTIVVNARGLTLYHLTSEKGGKIKCSAACAKQWPPLLLAAGATPKAGPGITAAKLGLVKRPDGTMQVTYAGAPLYRFAGDTKSGATAGEGFGGVWFALAPTGAIVKATAAPAAPAGNGSGSTPSAPGSPPSDYGY